MARLSKAEAARQIGISRTTLYKLIKQGKVSPAPDGTIDTSELARVVDAVSTIHRSVQREHRPDEHLWTRSEDTGISVDEHYGRPQSVHSERKFTDTHERPLTGPMDTLHRTVDILTQQLEAAREREQDYRDQIAWLRLQIEQTHQRYDRLLEAPRPATTTETATSHSIDRGAMRKQIVALLEHHPEGLSPVDVRRRLGVDKDLGSTMKAMARDGLLTRLRLGVYTVPR